MQIQRTLSHPNPPPSHPTHSTHTMHMRMTTSRKLKSQSPTKKKNISQRRRKQRYSYLPKAFGDPKHRQNGDPCRPKWAPKIKPMTLTRKMSEKNVRFMIQKTKRKIILIPLRFALCQLAPALLFPFSIAFFKCVMFCGGRLGGRDTL